MTCRSKDTSGFGCAVSPAQRHRVIVISRLRASALPMKGRHRPQHARRDGPCAGCRQPVCSKPLRGRRHVAMKRVLGRLEPAASRDASQEASSTTASASRAPRRVPLQAHWPATIEATGGRGPALRRLGTGLPARPAGAACLSRGRTRPEGELTCSARS